MLFGPSGILNFAVWLVLVAKSRIVQGPSCSLQWPKPTGLPDESATCASLKFPPKL